MSSSADVVAAVLALPLHQSLGLRLVDPADPTAGLELDAHPGTVNPSGVLHGGLVPLVMDVCAYLAVHPRLPAGAGAVTVSCTSSLLAAVPLGQTVRATATVDRLGRTMAYLSARVHSDGRLIATGQVVKAVVAPPPPRAMA